MLFPFNFLPVFQDLALDTGSTPKRGAKTSTPSFTGRLVL